MAGNDEEIRVQLTAETQQLTAGMNQAATTVEQTTTRMAGTVRTASNSILQDINLYNEGFGRNIKTMEQVNIARNAMDRLIKSGTLTAIEAAAANEKLDVAQVRVVASAERAAAALMKKAAAVERDAAAAVNGTVAIVGGLRNAERAAASAASGFTRFTSNTRLMSEASTIVSDVMSGQFGRIRRSAAAMANASGLLQMAFTPLGAVIAGVALAIGTFALAAVQGTNNMDELARVLLSTNNATGLTASGFTSLAKAVEGGSVSFKNARDAMEAMAGSGQMTGQQLAYAGRAAAAMAVVTGESMDKASEAILRMTKNPARGLADLNSQFHFLTMAQFEQVEALDVAGDHYGALTLALHLSAEGMGKLRSEIEQSRSPLGQFFDESLTGLSNLWQKIERFADGEQLQDYWKKATKSVQSYIIEAEHALMMQGGMAGAVGTGLLAVSTPPKESGGTKKPETEAEARKAQEEAQRISQAALADKKNKDTLAEQAQRDRFNSEMLANKWSLDQQRIYWSTLLKMDGAGVMQKRQATEELLSIRRQQETETGKIGRAEAAEAKRAAREAAKEEKVAAKSTLEELSLKRAATEEFSKERLNIDAEMTNTALTNFKKEPQAYYQMRLQEIVDTKSTAREIRRIDTETLKNKHDEQADELNEAMQVNDGLFHDGEITAVQLLGLQRRLVQQKLALDIVYVNAKKAIDKGDLLEVAKDDALLLKMQAKSVQQLLKLDANYHKTIRERWKATAHSISAAMVSSFDKMIMQGGKAKDILNGFARDMMQTFLRYEEDKFQGWLARELERLALSKSHNIADMIHSIVTSSAKAGAAGTASMAGAPYPMDLTAPAFGASMSGAAAGFAATATAEGGWGQVPYDGARTELHKDEMVLPKELGDKVRGMTNTGGGGMQVSINAVDARGIRDLFKRNGRELAREMRRQLRNGNKGKMS